MTASYKAETNFSLKDQLFHKKNVTDLSERIFRANNQFNKTGFVREVVKEFPNLELKERITHIAICLDMFIPGTYPQKIKVLTKALPPALDPNKTDNDFGQFINAPLSHFVALYGCTDEHVDLSLATLSEMTKRFSAEDAIRYFLNKYPKQTMAFLTECAKSNNYHVRRLASEGTRPALPWSQKINIPYQTMIPILDILYADKTRYVTRSVANHLNDISKLDAELVFKTLSRWDKEGMAHPAELAYIKKHALRTLVNKGNTKALVMLGYKKPAIVVSAIKLNKKSVAVGDAVQFDFTITATTKQHLNIDYVVHFYKPSGKASKKTFKISKLEANKNQQIQVSKKHMFRNMTTKTLYTGPHKIEIQINGNSFGEAKFNLV